MMITAWDFNNRSPRFFTKVTNDKFSDPHFNHNMTLKDMTWASASTEYYFKPAVIANPHPTECEHYSLEGEHSFVNGTCPDIPSDAYISGDNVAQSPAMFAYYYAN